MSGRGEGRDGGGESGAGGEVAMSIEETNKMRIALGLKPLKAEAEEPKGPSAEEVQRKEEAEAAAKAAELAERIKQSRERRQVQDGLDRTKKLGATGDDVDDVLTWVSKSRQTEQARQAEAAQRRRAAAQKAAARNSDSEDEEDEDMPTAAELAGAKVKHTADELAEGETMILTLEDRGILDDKGNLDEGEEDLVLENILAREDKARDKARKASGKQAKPLWEEDGKRRGLLDKYDEEEEQMMQIDDSGAVEAARQRRQEEIRARLAAGGSTAAALAAVAEDASVTVQQQTADYYTAEEMAKFQKPKKKKERKLKKKSALTEDELAALAADAEARGGSDLGSRASRQQRAADKVAAGVAADAQRRSRYDHALNKANYASLALRPEAASTAAAVADEDDGAGEEEEDLYASLAKARQLAQKNTAAPDAAGGAARGGQESMAAELIKRREEQQRAAAAARGSAPAGEGLVFTDVAEFARTIHVKQEENEAQQQAAQQEKEEQQARQQEVEAAAGPSSVKQEQKQEEDDYGLAAMDADEELAASDAAAAGDNVWAGWVPASTGDGETTAAKMRQKLRAKQQREQAAAAKQRRQEEEEKEEESMAREKTIGSGLAGALAFLKGRGELEAPVEWSGRTNDHKKVNIQGLEDVYTGGRQEDRLALDVEVALTRKDEYGRILTPKEAFRQLCYRFHGIQPSKNSREKRMKKAADEIAKKKATSDVGAGLGGGSLEQMKLAQKQAATPYVVLSGTVKPGQSRDAVSGYATVDRAEQLVSPTPILSKLPGGQTPLLGNAKVEAMLGIKRPGGESMPPPPPKAAKK